MSHDLIDQDETTLRGEPAVALATLIAATGSSSKKLGAKMMVGRSGRLIGGVTIGGCVDAQVIEAADALLDHGDRRVLSISLDDDEAWEIGLTCGGTVDVLLERVAPSDDRDPVTAAHAAIHDALARGLSAVMITPVEGDAGALVVREDGTRHGSLGDAIVDDAVFTTALGVLSSGTRVDAIEIAGGRRRMFFDRFAPPTTLVIVGAGQIAISLTKFARELGMRSIIVDGRERYATRERFPEADDIRVGMPSEIVGAIPANKRLAVILVAHDYKYELPVLRQLLRSSIGYLGMLGSKKRGVAVRELLRDEGFTDAELATIHTPIGLDIGGKSSAEVALSILAELVAVNSGKRV